MKKKIALLSAVAILSGCVTAAPAETSVTTITTTAEITEEITTTAHETTTTFTTVKPKETDLFPDEDMNLYPVASDKETKALFAEEIQIEKYSEQDFPNQEHLQLAKKLCWENETVQEKFNGNTYEFPADSDFTLPENYEDLTVEGLYYYDFDMDGENESFIHIGYLPFMSCGMLIYADGGTVEIIAEETGGSEISVYAFENFCYTQITFYYGMTGISTGIYDLRNGFSEPLADGTDCEYENGVFYIYRKSEFTDYPLICCPDGVLRQAGREEITREEFESCVQNGAEYLKKLEVQDITVNKIETWGHYTYQLSCTDRGADLGINITMKNDEAAYIRAPYEAVNEPKLTEEYIYGVDVWALSAVKQNPLSDEKGLLTEDYAAQVDKLIGNVQKGHPYAALQDFDGDDFPEIVVIEHNGGQGLMPCKIYNAETLEYMGEFQGFCRDGFTNFFETSEGVVVYNYYEHSAHSRYESYAIVENIDGVFTERILGEEKGYFNVCGAYNAGIVWENDCSEFDWSEYAYKFEEIWQTISVTNRSEGYCVSSFGYDMDVSEAGKFVVDFYNNCKRIEDIFIKEVAELESFSVFERPLLAIDDYDRDGKPEAFYQLNYNNPIRFVNSSFETCDVTCDYYAYGSYKLWNEIIVFTGTGNGQSCLIYTVNNGKAEEITELSGKGMKFNYSSMYNGCFELLDSEYDGPYHTWKPYTYYHDENGWHEFGSIEISKEEFLTLYGEEAQEIFDSISAIETPVENSGSYGVRSILYRSDDTYIINYGWDVLNEHIVVKPGITESDRLIEYPDYGGIYSTAFIPELAVYPDSTHPDFEF